MHGNSQYSLPMDNKIYVFIISYDENLTVNPKTFLAFPILHNPVNMIFSHKISIHVQLYDSLPCEHTHYALIAVDRPG